jgi:diadenosine tetraphosphatase ApaH/serine/threonine PP2A family protein phosphatase
LPDGLVPLIDWHASQLSADELALLRGWPLTLELELAALGKVVFCHATPRDDNEGFSVETPDSRIAPAFDGVDALLVVCGHTHRQFDRRVGDKRVVNAGSVGMPFDGPDAAWLLLDGAVQLRRTRYDRAAAAARVGASAYPRRDEFVESWLSTK